MINGNLINAQHLGPYDYICGNMAGQQGGGGYPYPTYPPSYYYGYSSSTTGHESRSTLPVNPVAPKGLSDANSSISTILEGGLGDKTLEWPDDFSDETDSESIATSLSTRCNSPEDDSLPTLTTDLSTR